ncbi:hypothetical protein [uncultured Methanolobus sp.]|uniref:hypothetical protein n=1 Tax=uncultured Methanolobus sp. TaxID=218300 RepID=UPI0029C6349D|nr:hypothetical protein [uncultured Methanolobus sp.]
MSDIKTLKDTHLIEFVKGHYKGYVGEVFNNANEYGYYIQIFKNESPVPRPKEIFKTKEDAVAEVKRILSSSH